jgi:thymidylate synthase (FAD)
MAHRQNPEAEQILDKEYPVLNKGFVRLVDYLGDDARIVEAARVSYAGGTKSYRQDRGLIRYLMRNEHTSPFEQVVFTFHLKMPIFVARQWVRHRTGRLNEISGRYSVMKEEYYLPEPEDIALQSPDNKQGRMEMPADPALSDRVRTILEEGREDIGDRYRKLLDMGLARELARIDLPLSLYTEWYWQMDLHNLFHFLKLRLDRHAQKEIRAYAEVILTIVETVCPVAAEAFRDFVLESQSFSAPEIRALRSIISRASSAPPGLSGSEGQEFFAKLGIPAPDDESSWSR